MQVQDARPLRHCILGPTLFACLGNLQGMKVMDVGCGSGIYTRAAKYQGAAEVVGNDISEKMIKLARQSEETKPLGIKYAVYDLQSLPKLGVFDIVIARSVLHYADTNLVLQRMLKSISKNLKTRGRLVAMIINPELDDQIPTKEYGYEVNFVEEVRRNGEPLSVSLFGNGANVSFKNYCWSKKTYEEAAFAAGFRVVSWAEFVCPQWCNREFWQGYLDNPGLVPVIFTK